MALSGYKVHVVDTESLRHKLSIQEPSSLAQNKSCRQCKCWKKRHYYLPLLYFPVDELHHNYNHH